MSQPLFLSLGRAQNRGDTQPVVSSPSNSLRATISRGRSKGDEFRALVNATLPTSSRINAGAPYGVPPVCDVRLLQCETELRRIRDLQAARRRRYQETKQSRGYLVPGRRQQLSEVHKELHSQKGATIHAEREASRLQEVNARLSQELKQQTALLESLVHGIEPGAPVPKTAREFYQLAQAHRDKLCGTDVLSDELQQQIADLKGDNEVWRKALVGYQKQIVPLQLESRELREMFKQDAPHIFDEETSTKDMLDATLEHLKELEGSEAGKILKTIADKMYEKGVLTRATLPGILDSLASHDLVESESGATSEEEPDEADEDPVQ